MNKELKTFTKRFGLTEKAPITFYRKFLSNHLYKTYYSYLDKQFAKYERSFNRELNSGKKQYSLLKKRKNWKAKEVFSFRNVA